MKWGVTAEQIQADAVAARNRGVVLMDMNEMIKSMIFGEEAENLLNEKLNVEAMENQCSVFQMHKKMNGASLLLQEDIRTSRSVNAWEVIGTLYSLFNS